MDISIIILNYKNKGLILEQLRYFFSTPCARTYEIIVVDNDSRDGIGEAVASEFPSVRFIESGENRGYAAGNNLGLRAARGTYGLIVNPDIVLTGAAVDALYDCMETHPKSGIAGPAIINADGTLQYTSVSFPDWWLPLFRRTFFGTTKIGSRWLDWYFMRTWDHASLRQVDWLFGSCLIVRMSALQKVGLLDEGFFLYLEDTDWCRRFWEHGYEVWYAPVTKLVHLHGRLSEGAPWSLMFNKGARIHVKSFIRYMWKYRGKANPHITT